MMYLRIRLTVARDCARESAHGVGSDWVSCGARHGASSHHREILLVIDG